MTKAKVEKPNEEIEEKTAKKLERIELEVSPQVKKLIQIAAEVEGLTVNEFVSVFACKAAEMVLGEFATIIISRIEEESRSIVELPPDSNDALIARARNANRILH